jgi:hypothetical protein
VAGQGPWVVTGSQQGTTGMCGCGNHAVVVFVRKPAARRDTALLAPFTSVRPTEKREEQVRVWPRGKGTRRAGDPQRLAAGRELDERAREKEVAQEHADSVVKRKRNGAVTASCAACVSWIRIAGDDLLCCPCWASWLAAGLVVPATATEHAFGHLDKMSNSSRKHCIRN